MKVKIIWKYKSPKNIETELVSDEMNIKEALKLSEDFIRTGRVKELTYVDEENGVWTKKELHKLDKGIETEPHNISAYFDGGFNKETNQAGIGIVIYYSKNGNDCRLRKNLLLDEIDSNNEAEFAALWNLIVELEELGVKNSSLKIHGDSQVVINQISEEWPVFDGEFNRWIDRIEEKIKSLHLRPTFNLIGRNENKEADQLATQAFKGINISSNTKNDE